MRIGIFLLLVALAALLATVVSPRRVIPGNVRHRTASDFIEANPEVIVTCLPGCALDKAQERVEDAMTQLMIRCVRESPGLEGLNRERIQEVGRSRLAELPEPQRTLEAELLRFLHEHPSWAGNAHPTGTGRVAWASRPGPFRRFFQRLHRRQA